MTRRVMAFQSWMLNIKGKDVQGETNPHKIAKMRREEE